MGCCSEKLKIERLKVLRHASVLTCQIANITNRKMAVVKLSHHHYGDYFDGMDYETAKARGFKILRKYEPGDTMAVQNGD